MSSGMYSYQTGVSKTFHWVDYLVFGSTLAISAAIGIFYAIKDRNKNTTEEYLLAGRSMHPIPVAMSLLSSFISAITILGTPAEVYVYSTMYWWISVAFIITAIGAAHIFIPVFYNLGITSVFQYAEMRFGRATRVIASIIYLTWMMFYMAIVLYAPSLALNAVTGLSLWGSVLAVSIVCIFYTALGGMKAVLWADTVQMTIVFAGMLTILIEGCKALGGLDKAWDIADRNGRIVIFEFNADPRLRHSVWNVVIGGGVFWCAVFGTNQAQVQRAISVRSVTRSRVAIWLNLPGMVAIITLSCLVGVVMYAFYEKCDPVSFGIISKADQLVPLWTMDLLGDMHGLPGLLLSTVFSGSLRKEFGGLGIFSSIFLHAFMMGFSACIYVISTISSGLNAVAAVLLEDFVKPMCCTGISNERATWMSRGFVIFFGCLSLAFAFIVSQVGTMILQLAYVLFGVLGGPLLGMFTLGMLFPWANKWGGSIGITTSLSLLLWIGLGTSITQTSVTVKPAVHTSACNWTAINSTAPPLIDTSVTLKPNYINDDYEGLSRLYTVSYIWYSGIGVVTVVVVGMIVSIITGITDTTKINPKLICPFFDIFFPYLPEKWRKPLRFGVRHGEEPEQDFDNIEKRKERIASLSLDDEIRPYFKNGKVQQVNGHDNVGYSETQYNTQL